MRTRSKGATGRRRSSRRGKKNGALALSLFSGPAIAKFSGAAIASLLRQGLETKSLCNRREETGRKLEVWGGRTARKASHSYGPPQPQEKSSGVVAGQGETIISKRIASSFLGTARLFEDFFSTAMSHRDHARSRCHETESRRGGYRQKKARSFFFLSSSPEGEKRRKRRKKTHGIVRRCDTERRSTLLLLGLPRRAHGDGGSSAKDVERSHGAYWLLRKGERG